MSPLTKNVSSTRGTAVWLNARAVELKTGDKITQEMPGGDGLPFVPVLNITRLKYMEQ